MSQKKGRNAERELCALLQQHGYDVRPGMALNYGQEPDVVGLENIHIEVKRVERLNVPEAMAQAIRDSEKFHDGRPVLFHRRNRQGWLCTLRMEDLMDLYERAMTGGSCQHENE